MAKRTTKTEVVTKALARSGPELTPSQIRLDDSVQTDESKVFTQSDLNQSMGSGDGSGGGGGGGIAPDLKDYAKTEYVDAGDAALDGKIAQVAKDLDAVENDYTTTEEFNTLNSKVSQNKKDIASLGDAFDTAVLAAQEGAENLEIELQSYAKKEDIPEGADLGAYAKTDYVDSADAALNDLIAANTKAIEDLPTAPDIDLDEYARLDGATFGGQVAVRNSNNWLFLDSKSIQMTAEGMLQGHTILTANSLYISNDDDSIAFSVEANSQLITAREFSVEAKEFIGDGSKLTNLPTTTSTANSLPGYKWKLEEFTSTSNPPPNGRMKFNADTNTFYINVNTLSVDKESVQLARSSHKFNTYEVNGTMLLSIFSEEDGLVYFGKILALQLKYYNGQTYFELTEANHAVSDLKVGTTYNVTVSGLF